MQDCTSLRSLDSWERFADCSHEAETTNHCWQAQAGDPGTGGKSHDGPWRMWRSHHFHQFFFIWDSIFKGIAWRSCSWGQRLQSSTPESQWLEMKADAGRLPCLQSLRPSGKILSRGAIAECCEHRDFCIFCEKSLPAWSVWRRLQIHPADVMVWQMATHGHRLPKLTVVSKSLQVGRELRYDQDWWDCVDVCL